MAQMKPTMPLFAPLVTFRNLILYQKTFITQNLETLKHQEITTANITLGEKEELESNISLLENVEEIRKSIYEIDLLLLFENFMKNLKIATRNSTLALWQAHYIKNLLTAKYNDLKCEIVPFITQGDRDKTLSLKQIGGKGAFVKELELALIEKRADIAVHSMKDVPAILPNELEIASIAPRHNPRDVVSTKYQTDTNGRTNFPLLPGRDYLVDSVILRPSTGPNTVGGRPAAMWESLWASLTFQIPG